MKRTLLIFISAVFMASSFAFAETEVHIAKDLEVPITAETTALDPNSASEQGFSGTDVVAPGNGAAGSIDSAGNANGSVSGNGYGNIYTVTGNVDLIDLSLSQDALTPDSLIGDEVITTEQLSGRINNKFMQVAYVLKVAIRWICFFSFLGCIVLCVFSFFAHKPLLGKGLFGMLFSGIGYTMATSGEQIISAFSVWLRY